MPATFRADFLAALLSGLLRTKRTELGLELFVTRRADLAKVPTGRGDGLPPGVLQRTVVKLVRTHTLGTGGVSLPQRSFSQLNKNLL